MPRYDIIIPHYSTSNLDNLLLGCLASVRETSRDYRIILVDNGGGLKSKVQIADEMERHDDVIVVENDRNLGFVRAVNQGLAISNAERVVILNNDTIVTPRWLDGLDMVLIGRIGISGPRADRSTQWQGREKPGQTRILKRGLMLAFFCVMIRRDVIDAVGFLDEDFGVGFGDDDNYCARAQASGFDIAFVPNVLVYHLHRSTFGELYSAKEIYDMQWANFDVHKRKLEALTYPEDRDAGK